MLFIYQKLSENSQKFLEMSQRNQQFLNLVKTIELKFKNI